MAREEDKHRGAEYVPMGPVRVDSGGRIMALEKRVETLTLAVNVLQSQIASLQCAAPKGIPKP